MERFKKQIIDHENGVRDLYRTREERRKQISAKGGKASKESWYKKKERATTILRIPYTPRGELKKAVQDKIQSKRSPGGIKPIVVVDGGNFNIHS